MQSVHQGMTAIIIKTGTKAMAGAIQNMILSASTGIMSSLVKILMTSAKDWKSPKGPARVGAQPGLEAPDNAALHPYEYDNAGKQQAY
jgi:hypothetical protein